MKSTCGKLCVVGRFGASYEVRFKFRRTREWLRFGLSVAFFAIVDECNKFPASALPPSLVTLAPKEKIA